MTDNLDELKVEYYEEDVLIVKQLDKKILSKGSWATIMFLYQELNKDTGTFGPIKVSIRRYRKRGNIYRQHSRLNISNAEQAKAIAQTLLEWYTTEDTKTNVENKNEKDA